MGNENHESKIDVRIIVQGLDVAQMVSKAVNNIQLEQDYNIIVSSIIPTTELSIVKKVATGADILLIGGYGHDETYNILFNELKTDFNHVGLFDYTHIIVEDESIDFRLAEKEILNSIIKSTLSYSLNLINIHADIEEIKSDFSAFKLRYEDIYLKEILEIFNLEELWQETFRQELKDEKRIVIATDKFKPENIIVGQNYIAAENKSKAIEWLNIVRTALIFVDDNADDLKKDLTDIKEEKVPEVRDAYDEIPDTFENFWD